MARDVIETALRDEIAIQVMMEMVKDPDFRMDKHGAIAAKSSYMMADMMMEARNDHGVAEDR
jgi:hypothetical protein